MIDFLAKGINYLAGDLLRSRKIILSGSLTYLQRKRDIDKNYFDQVRLSSLELASFEINQRHLLGDIAEVGVYRGKFAKYLNQYFPDRKLYLFDTFEGFDNRDVSIEKVQDNSTGTQDFSNTSVEIVLREMPIPKNCIPKNGFFPESAKGVAGPFVFVSLDADLFEPIYRGLQFFYPKLVRGGYIFVHDFNNDFYKGARKAVEQFCTEENLGFVTIPDVGGSAIICK
jgi:O-methyltransferase